MFIAPLVEQQDMRRLLLFSTEKGATRGRIVGSIVAMTQNKCNYKVNQA
jgi:hypothetical protein